MKRLAISLAVLASLSAGAAFAEAPSPTVLAESIPPNCTLDPWTGKLTCHIWPTCTIDPWTGKMTCPVPRFTARLQ
ncbi:MAG: hypothetical protein IT534_09105 [Bauldia sp.]|nr:hypothetical protein [Bauldia sp.]